MTLSKKEHINLRAYNDHESYDDFPNQESVLDYYKEKFESCDKITEFIIENIIKNNWKGNVVEIGSGNSKLLYRLENDKLLSSGYGIEVSKSRFLLAERYKIINKSVCVNNINSNILDVEPFINLDLVVGVDNIFQLVAPTHQEADKNLIKWVYKSLKLGGSAIFDFRDFSQDYLQYMNIHGNSEARIWQEFPTYDKYKYLFEYVFTKNDKLFLERRYLKRDTLEESISVIEFKMYSHKQLQELFRKYGFKEVKVVKNWFVESGMLNRFLIYAKK